MLPLPLTYLYLVFLYSIHDWPVDQTLIDTATQSLQGHERLSALIRRELVNNPLATKGIGRNGGIMDK